MLKPGGQIEGDEALEFYAKHTAQIEVRGKSGGCREVAVAGRGGADPLPKEPRGGETLEFNTVTWYAVF